MNQLKTMKKKKFQSNKHNLIDFENVFTYLKSIDFYDQIRYVENKDHFNSHLQNLQVAVIDVIECKKQEDRWFSPNLKYETDYILNKNFNQLNTLVREKLAEILLKYQYDQTKLLEILDKIE